MRNFEFAKTLIASAFCLGALFTASESRAAENAWVRDVKVVQFGTYQHSTIHFVWLSSGTVPACQQQDPTNPTLRFDENNAGGKSMVSVLTAAVISKVNVDVQVTGCQIIEVYLK